MRTREKDMYTRVALLVLTGGLLLLLVFSLGPASWASPGHNPHRQTIPDLTPWVYLPHVLKQHSASGVSVGEQGSRVHARPSPYLPLATRGY